jgi:hypothetical protein
MTLNPTFLDTPESIASKLNATTPVQLVLWNSLVYPSLKESSRLKPGTVVYFNEGSGEEAFRLGFNKKLIGQTVMKIFNKKGVSGLVMGVKPSWISGEGAQKQEMSATYFVDYDNEEEEEHTEATLKPLLTAAAAAAAATASREEEAKKAKKAESDDEDKPTKKKKKQKQKARKKTESDEDEENPKKKKAKKTADSAIPRQNRREEHSEAIQKPQQHAGAPLRQSRERPVGQEILDAKIFVKYEDGVSYCGEIVDYDGSRRGTRHKICWSSEDVSWHSIVLSGSVASGGSSSSSSSSSVSNTLCVALDTKYKLRFLSICRSFYEKYGPVGMDDLPRFDEELIGRAVAKDFEGHGLFTGRVIGVKEGKKDAWYHVEYQDGDCEDLTQEGVMQLLPQQQRKNHVSGGSSKHAGKQNSKGREQDGARSKHNHSSKRGGQGGELELKGGSGLHQKGGEVSLLKQLERSAGEHPEKKAAQSEKGGRGRGRSRGGSRGRGRGSGRGRGRGQSRGGRGGERAGKRGREDRGGGRGREEKGTEEGSEAMLLHSMLSAGHGTHDRVRCEHCRSWRPKLLPGEVEL